MSLNAKPRLEVKSNEKHLCIYYYTRVRFTRIDFGRIYRVQVVRCIFIILLYVFIILLIKSIVLYDWTSYVFHFFFYISLPCILCILTGKIIYNFSHMILHYRKSYLFSIKCLIFFSFLDSHTISRLQPFLSYHFILPSIIYP